MRLSSALIIGAAAVIGAALTPAMASAAVSGAANRSVDQAYSTNSMPAGAPSTLTFTVPAGVLTITAPATACLGANAPCGATGATGTGAPGSTVTGLVGSTVVSDTRANLTTSWTATASETDWSDTTTGDTTATPIPAADATYTPGTVTVTGTITATPSTVTLANTAQTVVARHRRRREQHRELESHDQPGPTHLGDHRPLFRHTHPVGFLDPAESATPDRGAAERLPVEPGPVAHLPARYCRMASSSSIHGCSSQELYAVS